MPGAASNRDVRRCLARCRSSFPLANRPGPFSMGSARSGERHCDQSATSPRMFLAGANLSVVRSRPRKCYGPRRPGPMAVGGLSKAPRCFTGPEMAARRSSAGWAWREAVRLACCAKLERDRTTPDRAQKKKRKRAAVRDDAPAPLSAARRLESWPLRRDSTGVIAAADSRRLDREAVRRDANPRWWAASRQARP